MPRTYHFISGLPRSGSTLLAAILRQNPRIHAAMTSPVGSLFTSLHSTMGLDNEFAEFIDEKQRERMLRGVFELYYQDHPQEVIVDTNRLWCARLPLLSRLFPEAKVLCTVRNVAWVMDSIERLVRKNAILPSKLFNGPHESDTVYHRLEALASRDRFVGFSYYALKEAFYSPEARNILVIDYEHLTQAPEKVLPLVYQFLGEPVFAHDFNNLDYQEPGFDARLGMHGLHEVKRKVAYRPRPTVLPPDLFQQYSNLDFWKNRTGSIASVINANPAPAAPAPASPSPS
ncbi:sulfotransferase family protein [Opitutus terrae]|uniref:Sulfotransferase n=1 Tax=Opitutus terrae (strain DSM 11246 / JCM 15787 / PB90-1) TaxID=452637 RepID=B1ZP39_OPITP|nr:sulfotransferase [Opitutus terrae]ACB77525.1 sulfotransferase [Opitutus terrae PB90-1]